MYEANMTFDVPILFLVFNRPDTTARVFERIRQIKPQKLFISADGPRAEKPGEDHVCRQVRDHILNNIDWICEVKTLFRERNLGCGIAVSEGISWFFNHVEEGIILEDDTLPDISFFNFCKILLEKYRDERSVWQIGGICHFPPVSNYSYYFSAYSHIWGWATWRRAWSLFDYHLYQLEPQTLSENLDHYFSASEKKFWMSFFKTFVELKYKPTWDYQWTYCMWYYKSLSILPTANLVSNIGFGETATHTKDKNVSYANKRAHQINQIVHNPILEQNRKADQKTSKYIFGIQSQLYSLYLKFKRKLLILLRK